MADEAVATNQTVYADKWLKNLPGWPVVVKLEPTQITEVKSEGESLDLYELGATKNA